MQVPTEQAVRHLMDFVRTETQRDSKHKKFCFLAILSVLQVYNARHLLVTGAILHLVLSNHIHFTLDNKRVEVRDSA